MSDIKGYALNNKFFVVHNFIRRKQEKKMMSEMTVTAWWNFIWQIQSPRKIISRLREQT